MIVKKQIGEMFDIISTYFSPMVFDTPWRRDYCCFCCLPLPCHAYFTCTSICVLENNQRIDQLENTCKKVAAPRDTSIEKLRASLTGKKSQMPRGVVHILLHLTFAVVFSLTSLTKLGYDYITYRYAHGSILFPVKIPNCNEFMHLASCRGVIRI